MQERVCRAEPDLTNQAREKRHRRRLLRASSGRRQGGERDDQRHRASAGDRRSDGGHDQHPQEVTGQQYGAPWIAVGDGPPERAEQHVRETLADRRGANPDRRVGRAVHVSEQRGVVQPVTGLRSGAGPDQRAGARDSQDVSIRPDHPLTDPPRLPFLRAGCRHHRGPIRRSAGVRPAARRRGGQSSIMANNFGPWRYHPDCRRCGCERPRPANLFVADPDGVSMGEAGASAFRRSGCGDYAITGYHQEQMTDVLIGDVPDKVITALDAHAGRLGLSRSEYLRRPPGSRRRHTGFPGQRGGSGPVGRHLR